MSKLDDVPELVKLMNVAYGEKKAIKHIKMVVTLTIASLAGAAILTISSAIAVIVNLVKSIMQSPEISTLLYLLLAVVLVAGLLMLVSGGAVRLLVDSLLGKRRK
jgi:hypothetical protein